ncbi:ATP-binding protein [Streptomyces harbinensis]|uniref:ATP-binding protein n=1 Tax=Streptomyces harbinensis TaxID=1176198 RepID=UPI00159074D4|nr:ATP-binding protein [Streptomyces harbinensis]QKV67511.1 ATP-binding protein [Streptomyces harbinensis]
MRSSVRATYGQRVREWPLLARADELELWRRGVAGVVRGWGASPSAVELVRLGVTELLSNVLRHVDDHACCLVLSALGDTVLVQVLDRSAVLPEIGEAPDWEAQSGRGLWMLREMADGFGSELLDGTTYKKVVWFRCNLVER